MEHSECYAPWGAGAGREMGACCKPSLRHRWHVAVVDVAAALLSLFGLESTGTWQLLRWHGRVDGQVHSPISLLPPSLCDPDAL